MNLKFLVEATSRGADDWRNGVLCLRPPIPRQVVAAFMERIETKHKGKMRVVLDEPFIGRSTGRYSQNNHAFGHARQLGTYTGDYVEEYLRDACLRAATKGYPTKVNQKGEIKPLPFKKASMAQAAIVIEQLHEEAGILGVKLIERNWEEEEYSDEA